MQIENVIFIVNGLRTFNFAYYTPFDTRTCLTVKAKKCKKGFSSQEAKLTSNTSLYDG